tara:strand:+ start:36 stop:524 length:489 start_codon:yes stop_codon:yes gene_type:complete
VALALWGQGRGATQGDNMAKMTLIAQHLETYEDTGKFGYKFQKGKPVDVNPSFALNSLGSPLFTIEFDRKDQHFLENVDQNQKNILKRFSVNLGEHSPTLKIPKLPSITKKVEEKEEEDELTPLPKDLSKLTIAKLKPLLEERGLSTEGKKAELIDRLKEEA